MRHLLHLMQPARGRRRGWADRAGRRVAPGDPSPHASELIQAPVDGTSGTMLAADRFGEPVGPARMYDEPCDNDAVMRAIAEHALPTAQLGEPHPRWRAL